MSTILIKSAFVLVAGLSATITTTAAVTRAPAGFPRQINETDQNTFADVVPSTEIHWVDCYTDGFQCTFLTVPLDYADPDAGTTDIAFIRYLISEDHEDLLYNPG